MDDQDEIQKPSSVILFRQSSVEIRLTPARLSEEFDDENDDIPKIVGCKKKSFTPAEEDEITKSVPSGKPLVGTKPKSVLQTTIIKENTDGNKIISDNAKIDNVRDNQSQTSQNKDGFKNELNKKLQKKSISYNIDKLNNIQTTNNTQTTDNKVGDNDTILENKNQDRFKDELSKRLEGVGLRKKSGPPPPPRVSSISIGKLESVEEKINIANKINTKEKGITGIMDQFEIKSSDKRESVEFSVGTLKALNKKETCMNKDKNNTETVGGAYKEEMATLRPKSPRPIPLKGEKEETIWDKIGTLGRKKRIKEVQEVQAEGKYAIDSPGCATNPIIPPEDYNLEDNEERCMIDPRAYDDPKFLDLLDVLKEWINDELASQRIIVQDLSEDLYDGQVLQKLLEKLTGDKLDVPEVTQSEEGQKQKLTVVLDHFNKVLGIQRQSHNKWNVESIHSKNIVAITHLLVALARHFRPPVRLPEHVSVEVVVVQKAEGKLCHKTVRESLTKTYDDVGMRCERDAFDTLFDHAPDKLQVVKKSLVTFVNKHLNKMNFEVTEIESQFHDGVYLIMLMGLLEGFFVPHYSFNLTPHEFDQKVHNVNFAFELMEETGLQKPKARPEDVVNMDLKSTLRVLYNLFLRYRTIL